MLLLKSLEKLAISDATAETERRSGGDSRMRIVQGPGQDQGAEAPWHRGLSAPGARRKALITIFFYC